MSFIDFTSEEKKKAIYRYSDFARIVQMFQKQEITMVIPGKWDDPFENYITNPMYKHSDGSSSKLIITSVLHGSCWTSKSVSDAMWRIYSPDKIAVRVKSTPELLGNALASGLKKHSDSNWFIGKVQYLSQKKILHKAELFASRILNDQSEIAAAKCLLLKRSSFSHEQEIRAFVFDRHRKSQKGILKIKIDPHEVIQSVLVDSRAPDEWLDIYSTYLKEKLGFKGKVSKSILYKPLEQLTIQK